MCAKTRSFCFFHNFKETKENWLTTVSLSKGEDSLPIIIIVFQRRDLNNSKEYIKINTWKKIYFIKRYRKDSDNMIAGFSKNYFVCGW